MGRKGLVEFRARLALLAFAALLLIPAAAWSHAGNPNFRSEVKLIKPSVPGVQFEVHNYDDRLFAVNRSGKDLSVDGYEGEPYIRDSGRRNGAGEQALAVLLSQRGPLRQGGRPRERQRHCQPAMADLWIAPAATSGTTTASTGCRRARRRR